MPKILQSERGHHDVTVQQIRSTNLHPSDFSGVSRGFHSQSLTMVAMGQDRRDHAMPKVLVLKVRGRHVERSFLAFFGANLNLARKDHIT